MEYLSIVGNSKTICPGNNVDGNNGVKSAVFTLVDGVKWNSMVVYLFSVVIRVQR